MVVFKNNGHPENLINNCFETLLIKKRRIQKKLTTLLNNSLLPALPYHVPLPLQIRTRLRRSIKDILNCCKWQTVFKSRKKVNAFRFIDRTAKEITSAIIYKFQCGLYSEVYYGEYVRILNWIIGGRLRVVLLAMTC